MIYILSSTEQLFHVEIRVQQSRQGDSAASASLALSLKKQFSHEAFTEQQDYLSKAATAVYVSLNKIDQRNRFKASVQLTSNSQDFNFIAGSSSSGLGYALALFDAWWSTQLNKPGFSQALYATGEISTNGEILGVGYVAEKINHLLTELEHHQPDTFYICVPRANENEIDNELRQRIEQLRGQLLIASRLQELLQKLLGDVYDGDPLGRWEAFKGLKSFEYEDSIRFFGRDKDIERLNNDLQNNQGVLIVSGQSGSGKSSLIKAGLIPYLEKHSQSLTWQSTTPKEIDGSLLVYALNQLNLQQPQEKRHTAAVLAEMAEQIRQGKADPNQLSAFFLDANSLLLLHIDQFEEYFTSAQTQANSIELDHVHELTKQLPQLKVIVSIRNEYISILLESGTIKSPVISNVTGNLSLESWQDIIYEQAAFSGYSFEQQPEDLASLIIDHALKTPNALPMVEFLLEQIAEKAKDSATPNLLKHQDYETLGGLEGAIANRANACIDNHNQGQLHRFFSLFVATNNEGIAYARPVSYPADYIQQNTSLNQLIKSLRNANILIAISDSQHKSYLKLAHDSLFTHWQTLKDWLADQQRYLAWRNDIERSYKQWQQDQNKHHYLKDPAQRQEGLNYLKAGLIAEPDLAHYLQKSHSYANTRRFALLAIFLIPIMMIAGYFYDQNRIKVEYHTAITEKWSVPVGLHEISESKKKQRTGIYKLEYKEGKLRSLSYVNSFDTLISDSTRNNNSKWIFYYREDGSLIKTSCLDQNERHVYDHSYIFDADMKRSIMTISNNFLDNRATQVNFKENAYDITGSEHNNSQISRYLLQYDNEGMNILIELQSSNGKKTELLNKYSVIEKEYNENNLLKKIRFLKKNNKSASSIEGIYQTEYTYDDKKEIKTRKDFYDDEKYLKISYERNDSGNVLSKAIYDDQDTILSSKTNKINPNNGLIYSVFYDFKTAINNLNNETILTEKHYHYDNNGRIIGIQTLDQFNRLIKANYTYDFPFILNDRVAVEYLSNIDNIKIEYYKDGLVKTVIIDDNAFNLTYDQKKRSISFSSFNIKTKQPNKIEANIEKIYTPTKVFEQFSPSSKFYTYDNEGMLIDTKALDKNLNITLTTKYEYIDSGKFLVESLWINDEPAETNTKPHITKHQFDENDNTKEIRYLNTNNKPVKDSLNCAIWKYDNDDYGRVLSRSCFDEHENPTISAYNYHSKEFKYSNEDNYLESITVLKPNNQQTYLNYTHFTNNLQKKIEPREAENEVVYLESQPSGALVYHDDKLIGITPLTVKPHSNNLRLEKDGYHSTTADNSKFSTIPLSKINKIKSKNDIKFNESVNNIFNNTKIEDSVEALIDLSNDKYGQAALALYYWFLNTNQIDKAKLFLARSIELEDADAMGIYASLLINGDMTLGVEKNTDLANNFALKAIEKGNFLGYNMLGMIDYLRGDFNAANTNFDKSCNKGNPFGCYFLATTFLALKDIENSFFYYKLSSNLRFNEANYKLFNLNSGFDYPFYADAISQLYYAYKAWELEPNSKSAIFVARAHESVGDFINYNTWIRKALEIGDTDTYISDYFFSKKGTPINYYLGIINSNERKLFKPNNISQDFSTLIKLLNTEYYDRIPN